MSAYRLVEFGRLGALTLPRVYESVPDALDAAEAFMDALAHMPHRRPFRVDVVDVATGEPVTRYRPDRDRSVCAVCGAPDDPFVQGAHIDVADPAPAPGSVAS